MLQLFVFCVLLSTAVISANGLNTSNTQQQTLSFKNRPCNTNNYNNFYAGPNKKVENLLVDMKRQLNELQRQVELLNKENNSTKEVSSSCKEIFDKKFYIENKAYPLTVGSGKIPVYCQMTELGACGGGGWTLVMKTDGTKRTFHHSSSLWSNKETFNLPGGSTGFDTQETKLPTYWNTPFTKICLGMKIGQQNRFIVINKQANSLYSLIADGQCRATSLGRNTWETLIGTQATLQTNCNKEGFNVAGTLSYRSKVRIGILGNEQNDCSSPDSRIGFGAGGSPDDNSTCGNVNEATLIKAMGYILVQ